MANLSFKRTVNWLHPSPTALFKRERPLLVVEIVEV